MPEQLAAVVRLCFRVVFAMATLSSATNGFVNEFGERGFQTSRGQGGDSALGSMCGLTGLATCLSKLRNAKSTFGIWEWSLHSSTKMSRAGWPLVRQVSLYSKLPKPKLAPTLLTAHHGCWLASSEWG